LSLRLLKLISLLKKYHIKPIFVFDNKPQDSKKELIEQRRNEREKASSAQRRSEN
jgi:5'-3' exonuclease